MCIRAVEAKRDITFAAIGSNVMVWKRSKQLGTMRTEKENHTIVALLVFGDHLLALSSKLPSGGSLFVFDIATRELQSEIEFSSSFTPTTLLHPHTYMNKVLVASREGKLQLWNVKKGKMIYEFKSIKDNAAIAALAQSPALDVIAAGDVEGNITVLNLKSDSIVVRFRHAKSHGAVTALSFRTQENGMPLLVSATASGSLLFFNLKKRLLHHTVDVAHEGGVIHCEFLPNQPVLVSTGKDNAIKQWLLDSVDSTPRLLRSRCGHSAPPKCIKFFSSDAAATSLDGSSSENNCQLLSAGQDRTLRYFHTARAEQTQEFSQGIKEAHAKRIGQSLTSLKLPPIVDMACCGVKSRYFGSIVTIHENCDTAYVWSFPNKRLCVSERNSKRRIKLTPENVSRITSVDMSVCGNMALLGNSDGSICSFNVQSGRFRARWSGHTKDVTGIAVDQLNRTIVSCSLDSTLRFWNLQARKNFTCEAKIELPCPASKLKLHRDSGLAAVVCDDFQIRIYDIEARKLVRRFGPMGAPITDLIFSPDARWVLCSTSSGDLRVFDIASCRCIEWMRFRRPVTSLAMTPCGDKLITSHTGVVGLFQWINRVYYGMHTVSGWKEMRPRLVDMPTPQAENVDVDDDDDVEEDDSDSESSSEEEEEEEELPLPTDTGLELAGLPRSKWTNLDRIAEIRERNKPTEAPKAPQQAPFFLPTKSSVEGMELDIVDNDSKDEDQTKPKSRILTDFSVDTSSRSRLAKMLCDKENDDVEKVAEYLKSLDAPALETEIQSLSMGVEDYETSLLVSMIRTFTKMVKSQKNFEATQAYLSLFMKIHSAAVSHHFSDMEDALRELRKEQAAASHSLESLLQKNLCLVKFFSRLQ